MRPLTHGLARSLTDSLAHSLTSSLTHGLARTRTHQLELAGQRRCQAESQVSREEAWVVGGGGVGDARQSRRSAGKGRGEVGGWGGGFQAVWAPFGGGVLETPPPKTGGVLIPPTPPPPPPPYQAEPRVSALPSRTVQDTLACTHTQTRTGAYTHTHTIT